MSEIESPTLSGVAETSLIALYIRALESQRPGGLIKDEKAVALVAQMSDEFVRIQRFPMSDMNIAATMRRNQKLDHHVMDFLARHPDAVVVHIGCGLDTRFERVDNGQVEWYETWICRTSSNCAGRFLAMKGGVTICWVVRRSRTPGWRR